MSTISQEDINSIARLGSGLQGSVFAQTPSITATAPTLATPYTDMYFKPQDINLGAISGDDNSILGGLGSYLKDQKLSDLVGLAGTGFSIYDSLWGTGADLKQAQIDLLNQQVAHNKDAMEDKNKFQANVASGANAGTAAGLAAASQTK